MQNIKNAGQQNIRAWQIFLDRHSFNAGQADGIWGAHTEEATKQFQLANKLSADGVAGTNTIAAAEKLGFSLQAAPSFPPPGQQNTVFDISHHNSNVDFAVAKQGNMAAVLHKATQSIGNNLFHDPKYPENKSAALAAGLLWGAYHFGTSGDGAAQANAFLAYTQPHNNTLLALDFERATTPGESSMSLQEAEAFVTQVKAKTGKYPGVYGGNLLRRMMANNPSSTLLNCWLWIAQYEENVHLPNGWSKYELWQYTDGVHGPGAQAVPGVGHCDRSLFPGTAQELKAFWQQNQA